MSEVENPPQAGATEESIEKVEDAKSPPKTQIEYDRYIHKFELYDSDEYKYVPWDPTTYTPPPPPKEDLHNYFHVVSRYDSESSATPQLLITNWSKTLVRFMRTFVGDPFFNSRPEYKVQRFFPKLEQLRAKWNEAKSALSMESMLSLDEKVVLAKALGNPHVHQNSSEAELIEQITQIVEHLSVLMAYLDEQFKPTMDRLKLETSHGQISYDLLIYFFKVGDILYSYDDEFGLPFAFTLHKRWYQASTTESYFLVTAITRFWNGNQYKKQTMDLKLRSFEGTKEISELAFQHLDSDMKEKLVARGKLYVTYSGIHYKRFRGNRIMIDRTAYNYQGGYDLDPDIEIPELEEQKLHFLPPEVYGFNLSTKKWQSFLVDEIQPVVFDEKAWDHLVLDPDTKTLIKGLVEVTKNENTTSRMVNDVISGKGGGLIAVLHGPPGTGKTLTAEAVAENLQRPLYMVGSTELSTSPSSLESNLKKILKLASAWDAVLLIDEADVFLEQRSLHEIGRNALVSVALRVLEYHRGVLFLTTNRIKTFDEAFLSRFSIAISYPELDQTGRFTVWSKFFELAGCRIVEKVEPDQKDAISKTELMRLASKPFNGRTIKNLVRTAQALALSTNSPLCLHHVQTVVNTQEKFLKGFSQCRGQKRKLEVLECEE
ncbi:P-loop containing nucleoside triphosphate hydrolase protein [Dendrothele bispora CBS 962.96]|uniref:P-loop containing nucleoside triphosphate hydrolase protein n=1 Tax=Dendrothele bispora (strain CBS 962.96) TaxID=1314807 RepID=A0A4S8M5Z7_DENBC|nr:P-loop containing nucleoside triphosphate hydrolase protein [Dendrothele bispora CBS 962.96]